MILWVSPLDNSGTCESWPALLNIFFYSTHLFCEKHIQWDLDPSYLIVYHTMAHHFEDENTILNVNQGGT